ncbi:hypothetical protein PoB_000836200 [Plakobranchus ocellatus]|uniref:Uncharacterized protein n=1 Tax=Plakobranchus ocellatus TaxID=259542 RepID=A0AAV3YG79_9GAST|nr:hypothetical protein PoB_000836200 [Plakobranchus ocellatus]
MNPVFFVSIKCKRLVTYQYINQAPLTGRYVHSSLERFLSYPLLAASKQPAILHTFCAVFSENTSGNAEQCTSHQLADSYQAASSHSFWCGHFEPTARNCSKRLAQLTRSYGTLLLLVRTDPKRFRPTTIAPYHNNEERHPMSILCKNRHDWSKAHRSPPIRANLLNAAVLESLVPISTSKLVDWYCLVGLGTNPGMSFYRNSPKLSETHRNSPKLTTETHRNSPKLTETLQNSPKLTETLRNSPPKLSKTN